MMQLALIAIVYYGAARLGLTLAFAHTNASPVWPPSGVAVAALLLLGLRVWPAIAVGAFAANLLTFTQNPALSWTTAAGMSISIATGNALEAFICAWLLRRLTPSGRLFGNLLAVFKFVPVALLSSMVSAGIGVLTLIVGGGAPSSAVGTILPTWWLGDMTGILVVTPLLVSWGVPTTDMLPGQRREDAWVAILAAVLLILALPVVGAPREVSETAAMFLAVVLVAWATYHFGLRGATTASMITATIAVLSTIRGLGPFATGSLNNALIQLDTFVALCTVAGLVLAADLKERLQLPDKPVQGRDIAVPWLSLLVSLGLTIIIWQAIVTDTERSAQERFNFTAADIERRIAERMHTYEQILRGAAGLFQSSQSVTRAEWREYVSTLRVGATLPGIQGVGYVETIHETRLAQRLAEIRADGKPDFRLYPEGNRPEYTTIVYLEPDNWRNRRAFGYDMTTDPTRRAALVLARDTGNAVVSGKVRLVQETAEAPQAGFLMYMPLYRQDKPTNTVAARHAALYGYVYAPFRVDDLMAGIGGLDRSVVALEVFYGPKTTVDDRLYASANLAQASAGHFPRAMTQKGLLTVGQKQWTVRITSLPSFEAGVDRQKAQIVLICGMLISVLVFSMVRALAITRASAMQLAGEMTAALGEAEAKFGSMVQVANVGVIIADEQGTVISGNPHAATLFGYPQDSLSGRRIEQLLPGYLARLGAASVAAGMIEDTEGVTAQGWGIPVELSLSSWQTQRGRLYGFILRDISERKRTAEFFRGVFKEGPEAILVIDGSGLIVQANDRADEVFRYSRGDLIGLPVEQLLPERLRAGHLQRREAFMRTQGRRPMNNLTNLIACRRDGNEFPVEVALNRLALNEGSLVIATVVDVTARRQAETRLRETTALQSAILDSSDLSIIATDPAGTIVSFNKAAQRMLGYREDEMVGRVTPALIHDAEEVAVRAGQLSRELGQLVEPGFEVFVAHARAGRAEEREWTYVRKDGSRFPVLLSVTAIHDQTGQLTGFLGIAADTTDRKRHDQALRVALGEKETLLKEVYHRVKNNLAVITSLFNLQVRAMPVGAARTALQESAERVRAMALVHEKLYQSANLSSISLEGYVVDLCRQLATAAAADARGIVLTVKVDPIEVGLDTAVPLGLLLNELVSNSFKHGFPEMRAGHIRVSLKCGADGDSELVVADDGIGFPPAFQPRGGSSLGLRLAANLSGQLGGELSLENRDGAYARLAFQLTGMVGPDAAGQAEPRAA